MEDHAHPELDGDPLHDTKIGPEDQFPLRKIGVLTLNRNVDNFFAENERIAMGTAGGTDGVSRRRCRGAESARQLRALTAQWPARSSPPPQQSARDNGQADAVCARTKQRLRTGTRIGNAIGVTADVVRGLAPLAGQVLTAEDEKRLQNIGSNADKFDASQYGTWTGGVENRAATAEEVLGGMRS